MLFCGRNVKAKKLLKRLVNKKKQNLNPKELRVEKVIKIKGDK